MKPTIKNINKYLQAKVPQLQFVKGHGYFYFSHADDVPEEQCYIMPESIYTYALHQLDWERWTWEIDRAVAQFEIDNGTPANGSLSPFIRTSACYRIELEEDEK